jgi:hypothetical protein
MPVKPCRRCGTDIRTLPTRTGRWLTFDLEPGLWNPATMDPAACFTALVKVARTPMLWCVADLYRPPATGHRNDRRLQTPLRRTDT